MNKYDAKEIITTSKSCKPKYGAVHVFPIVGIGASEGGLKALALFLEKIPIDSGVAFVIVQKQASNHLSVMTDMLKNSTQVSAYQIENGMQINPNNVYWTPPGFELSIAHNICHLQKIESPEELSLPIDFFFRSLAEDKRQYAIGVILSGIGSDGTLGLQAIKERGGSIFVEEPISAEFMAMPQHAINTGSVDGIAPAQELPARILDYLHYIPLLTSQRSLVISGEHENLIEIILDKIRTETDQDFSFYKRNTLYRRIERRMGLYKLASLQDYVQYLDQHKQEISLLFKELLIGVTRFFRDPQMWEELKNDIFPLLFLRSPPKSILRAWVAGCSTGEEAYSLAIIFKEALEKGPNKELSLQIFATDLDKDNIEKARIGFFSRHIISTIPQSILCKYFTKEEGGYRINKDIREMVIFAPQNIIMDPSFTKLDILICRNLLIYFNMESQKKLLNLFHYSLNPNGFLVLGTAETVSGVPYLFSLINGKTRIFRRLDLFRALWHVEFPYFFPRNLTKSVNPPVKDCNFHPPNLKTLVESILLENYCPTAILVTDQGDILYIKGKSGKYLEPAVGRASLNLFAMAREGLKESLSESFQKAIRYKSTITLKGVIIKSDNDNRVVDVTIFPIIEEGEFSQMILMLFADGEPSTKKEIFIHRKRNSKNVPLLIEELQHCQKELQHAYKEMYTSQEELRAVNEELQSANEELQSTNEELTTSKEEMQSMNEELQTINNELQGKLDELSQTSNDMHNLLNSTDIAILFLDEKLNVRRFTNKLATIFKLIPTDIDRKITDIVSDLYYPSLAENVRKVLETLIFKETQVPTHDNTRWFIVKIIPYRTLENRIDGVVITFTDISQLKKLEMELKIVESNMINFSKHKKTHPSKKSRNSKNKVKVYEQSFQNSKI